MFLQEPTTVKGGGGGGSFCVGFWNGAVVPGGIAVSTVERAGFGKEWGLGGRCSSSKAAQERCGIINIAPLPALQSAYVFPDFASFWSTPRWSGYGSRFYFVLFFTSNCVISPWRGGGISRGRDNTPFMCSAVAN